MKQKLNCILLVDDDEPTNFINLKMIKHLDCADLVTAVESGQKGLDYLNEAVTGKLPWPDIIFVDINMPAMTGWEFIAAFDELYKKKKTNTKLIMLTTSINPADAKRAESHVSINEFRNKPLSLQMIKQIINKYFP